MIGRNYIISFAFLILISCQTEVPTEKFTPSVEQDDCSGKILSTTDTIIHNDYIIYSVTADTVVDNLEISVSNNNIADSYVIQSFYLNETTLLMNHFPDIISRIEIKKDDFEWVQTSLIKTDLPENPMSEYLNSMVLKDVVFSEYNSATKELVFKTSLIVPNTNFLYDYEIIISPSGERKIRWIDYEYEG